MAGPADPVTKLNSAGCPLSIMGGGSCFALSHANCLLCWSEFSRAAATSKILQEATLQQLGILKNLNSSQIADHL